jgi:hypothetical protein
MGLFGQSDQKKQGFQRFGSLVLLNEVKSASVDLAAKPEYNIVYKMNFSSLL